MIEPKIGSMFSGYGGLDMAVQEMFGGSVAWFAENNPDASKVLAHHWPGIPNLGDVTEIDWTGLEPVDIIAAGFPCQNISNAGDRKGITGDRSRLWKNVVNAVRILRPQLVILENVAAIRTRGFDVVACDLAAFGYDTVWTCVRASEAGAPHRRDRWFCAACSTSSHADKGGWGRRSRGIGQAARGRESAYDRSQALTLLPTPDTGMSPNGHARRGGRPGNGRQSGVSLDAVARNLTTWREYESAVRRWEEITGCPAPEPTEPAPRGGRRLSPALPEWMMGLPPGHVTEVPGITRNGQLRVIGGGVVPQQAVAALHWMAGQWAALESNAA